jgi:flavin-dependent thymidylate synthase
MKVELLSCTPDALKLLLGTKDVRLSAEGAVDNMTEEEKLDHLAYMRDTIKSSWEFVDYTFKISGVTRAFTHQLVRTRTGSYAQQTQRAVDVRDHEVVEPEVVAGHDSTHRIWADAVRVVMDGYGRLMDLGVAPQDARGLLPTHVTTTILAKFNLRTLHDMALVRLCTRTQGEYQHVFRAMKREVTRVHPWAGEFIQVACVDSGVCAFPRYGKAQCPVYFPELDNLTVRQQAKLRWDSVDFAAAPRVAGGKAQ